jgi:hypothetical protein
MSLYHAPAYSCEDDTECPRCGEKSDLTWNPSNQYVTPKLSRFYEMEDLINTAYEKGDYDKAKTLIQGNLELAAYYRCNWNYGNAIHDSNRILGFIALKNNDVAGAANYLIEAGKSTGSPQLDSFGPNLDLANELLSLGEREAVISYLLGVRSFWDGNESIIDEWIQKIKSGEEVQLNQYQPGIFEQIAYILSLAWPLALVIGFWFKIRARLSNNWSFPLVAVLSAFSAMILGGIIIGPLAMFLIEVVSEDLLGPLLIGISVLVQLGAPFLAIYFVARHFKNRAAPNNG